MMQKAALVVLGSFPIAKSKIMIISIIMMLMRMTRMMITMRMMGMRLMRMAMTQMIMKTMIEMEANGSLGHLAGFLLQNLKPNIASLSFE